MGNLRGKTALVTGAGGFIGSHLAQALVREGCIVRALVFYNSNNSWGWLDSLHAEELSHIEVISGDVRDGNAVLESMQGVDLVFHLAALISIPYSYIAPDSYVDTNIKGTLNILQAAKKARPGRVFITSTSEVYGTAQSIPMVETHPYQGQSPYSATKIGADRLAESFMRSFNLPITIVRPFNTYGPRQSLRAVIPTIITQMLSGKKEIKLGRLSPTRDFVFVKDTVQAFIDVAKTNETLFEEVNIATGQETSIGELANILHELLNSEACVVQEDFRVRPEKSEVDRLCGSNEKITRLTGWRPRYDLKSGLAETIDWFSEPGNTARYKMSTYGV